MNESDIKRYRNISIILFFVVLFVTNFSNFNFNKVSEISVSDIKIIQLYKTWTFVNIFWMLYFWIGWQYSLFKKIIYRENLNGSWLGTYQSTDILTKVEYKGDIAICINQNFFSIKINSFTEKQNTNSTSASFNFEKNSLDYFYVQETEDLHNELRKGGAQLKFDGKNLRGNFFTNGNTKGFLNLTRITTDKKNSFEKIKKLSLEDKL